MLIARLIAEPDTLSASLERAKARIAQNDMQLALAGMLDSSSEVLQLALPEGDAGAPALVKFAQLDGMHRLIGGKPIAVDMRVPDRVYLRCKDGPCPTQLARNGRAE